MTSMFDKKEPPEGKPMPEGMRRELEKRLAAKGYPKPVKKMKRIRRAP